MIERDLIAYDENPEHPQVLSTMEICLDFILYGGYSILDKFKSLQSSGMSFRALWMDVINADLFVSHSVLEVPVYFFQGKYDMHTVTAVTKEYFEAIEVPHKEDVSFDRSAHWPHITEYNKYRQELKNITNNKD